MRSIETDEKKHMANSPYERRRNKIKLLKPQQENNTTKESETGGAGQNNRFWK